RQEKWAEVLQRTKEALRLVPNDPGWLATQEQAQRKLRGETREPTKTAGWLQTRKPVIPSIPRKTKEQWLDEGYTFFKTKQYEDAIVAYDNAIALDPTYAPAHSGKGGA